MKKNKRLTKTDTFLPDTFFLEKTDSFFPSLFSSPDHNVLRMSYCDRSLSGVHPSIRPCVRPSVREQLLKKSSALKPANRFQRNFTEMILG